MRLYLTETGFDFTKDFEERILKSVHTQFIRLWKDGVRAFLTSIIDEIHVDTSMSVASLHPLAKQVRLASLVNQRLTSKTKPGHKKAKSPFADNNAPLKSASLGKLLGQRAYVLETGTYRAPILRFKFEIVVLQYFLHDLGLAKGSSGAWGTLEKGQRVFEEFIDSNWVRYLEA